MHDSREIFIPKLNILTVILVRLAESMSDMPESHNGGISELFKSAEGLML